MMTEVSVNKRGDGMGFDALLMTADGASMNPVSEMLYLAAGACGLGGLGLILFPRVFKRWADAQYNDPYRIRPAPPEGVRLNSLGSIRAMGVGLLLIAALMAYYARSIR